jgi:low temperature requirement protein LtrA
MTTDQSRQTRPLLRQRDGHHARVTFEELFFDLVYVFAVTQLSHELLHNLTFAGVGETLILWFAVWLGWQYTCWVTNWFDPEAPRIRLLLFAVMLAGLVMAAAIPDAFAERGLAFASAYVAIQMGRTGYIVWELGPDSPLSANYRRMFGWLIIAALFWIAGAFADHSNRAALWAIAVGVEYLSPMIGFALPGLGRSRTSDWTIEGGHLAERCQQFVIVALGESVLATGLSFAETRPWTPTAATALFVTFLGSLAMWWLYFGTSGKDATATITASHDPGRIGAYFHYVHAILVAGIVVMAVGNDLLAAHPYEILTFKSLAALAGGPVIFLSGSAIYRWVVYRQFPWPHLTGVAALVVLASTAMALGADLLALGAIATAVMLLVGVWEGRARRRRQSLRTAPSSAN